MSKGIFRLLADVLMTKPKDTVGANREREITSGDKELDEYVLGAADDEGRPVLGGKDAKSNR